MNRINLINAIEKYVKFVKINDIIDIKDIEVIINEEKLNSCDLKHLKKVINKIINDEEYKMIDDGELLSNNRECVIIKEYNDEEFEIIKNNYFRIRNIISPPQRSPMWFALRNKVISASDGGCALGLNKYEPQYKFIYKKVFGSTFITNNACYWGKCYEDAVVRSYEYLNDCVVEEFGLLPNEKQKYISASPDGIVHPFRKDGSKSNIPSRMLEIKCVVSRQLKFEGGIYDNMCPQYYWVQTQLQMQTTDVCECDFAQYKLEEYSNKEDFLEDTHNDCDFKSKEKNLERGLLIEVLPKILEPSDYLEDNMDGYLKMQTLYDKAKSIFPPKLDLTLTEMDEWIEELKRKLENNEIYDEIQDDKGDIISTIYFGFHKVKYYRIIERNCTLIVKDDKWFEDKIPVFKSVWDNVLFLRENEKIAQQWKNYIDSMFRKNNKSIMEKLYNLTNIKIPN
jgi:putative phage-type endonuclease